MCLFSKIEKILLLSGKFSEVLTLTVRKLTSETRRAGIEFCFKYSARQFAAIFSSCYVFFVLTLGQIRYFEHIYSRGLFHAGVLQNLHRVSLLKFNQFVFASLSHSISFCCAGVHP